MSCKYSIFEDEFVKDCVNYPLNIWYNLPIKSFGPELFLVRSFKITNSTSLLVLVLFKFFCSSEKVFVVCIFLGICPIHLDYLNCWHRVVHSFPYHPFNFCHLSSNVSSFISDFSNLYFLCGVFNLAKRL